MNLCQITRPARLLSPMLTMSCVNHPLKEPSDTYSRNFISYPCRTFYLSCVIRKNYYDVLGLTPKASPAQIKSAYYRLSKQFHPDVNKSEEAKKKFAEISDAYQVLSSKQSRRNYDYSRSGRGSGLQSATRTRRVDDYEDLGKRTGSYKERPKAPMSGKTAHFDFDEFYRAHYGDALAESIRKKEKKRELEYERKQMEAEQSRLLNVNYFILIVASVIVAFYYISDWEERNRPRQTDIEKNK